MSALTDAMDNSRHLFIFQVITEVMILMFAAGLLSLVRGSPSAKRRASIAVVEEESDQREMVD